MLLEIAMRERKEWALAMKRFLFLCRGQCGSNEWWERARHFHHRPLLHDRRGSVHEGFEIRDRECGIHSCENAA